MSFEIREVLYNGETQKELVGMAKLIGLPSKQTYEYKNAQGETKLYRLGTIEITTPNGKTSSASAQIHERNMELMEQSGQEFTIGTSYLTTLRAGQDADGNPRIFATTSHLVASIMSAEVTNELAMMLGATVPTAKNAPEVNTEA